MTTSQQLMHLDWYDPTSVLANFASTQCPNTGIGKTQTVRWQLKVKGHLPLLFRLNLGILIARRMFFITLLLFIRKNVGRRLLGPSITLFFPLITKLLTKVVRYRWYWIYWQIFRKSYSRHTARAESVVRSWTYSFIYRYLFLIPWTYNTCMVESLIVKDSHKNSRGN